MYIGDTSSNGIQTLIRELCCNSINQILNKKADQISVKIEGDHIFVSDDGEGLPFDVKKEGHGSLASYYFTNFKKTEDQIKNTPIYITSSWSLGLVTINALSEELICRSWRSGQLWEQSFKRGTPVSPAKIIKSGNGKGTVIQFTLDRIIFDDSEVPLEKIKQELEEVTYLHPTVKINLNNQTIHNPSGFTNFIEDKFGKGKGFLHRKFSIDDLNIQVAVYDNQDKNFENKTEWLTWANGCRTLDGGSHERACRSALKYVNWQPSFVALHVIIPNPKFIQAIKRCLDNPEIERAIREKLALIFREYLSRNN